MTFEWLDWNFFWWAVIIILFILSYVGLIVPGIPDAPMMLAGFVVYAIFIDSEPLQWWFWVFMVAFVIVLVAMDWISSGIAAQKMGGSKGTMVAAPLGMLFLFWLPFGIVLGPFIGVFVWEIFNRKPIGKSIKIAFGTVVGFISNIVIKIVLLTLAKAWFFYLIA
jgi:uncharacterized protein YqgC (DUF456 family)